MIELVKCTEEVNFPVHFYVSSLKFIQTHKKTPAYLKDVLVLTNFI